ncbi:MAG: hypothetical protein KDB03_20760 [Planctomycetales bacterium]|nr:hypothetical protein [Planctomycetales bacterium]
MRTSLTLRNVRLLQLAFYSLSCLWVIGCATHAHRLALPRDQFFNNQLTAAHTSLEKVVDKARRDRSVAELDLAIIELFNGDAQTAQSRLREVRDRWEHLEQTSLAEQATGYMTDDQRLAYSGEDYEKLLVGVFLTLSDLMQGGIDAESYTLQTIKKHADLIERLQAKSPDESTIAAYRLPAIAPYLRGVLREETHRNYDDALEAYQQAIECWPHLTQLQSDIERVEHGVHSSPGNGVLYVFALVGRGPYKVETTHEVTSEALLVADQIFSALGKYSVPPTLAPVKIPAIACEPKPFEFLGVQINQLPAATTMSITDLNLLAIESFAANQTQVIARAAVRRVLKKGTVYAAKEQLEASSPVASFAMDAMGVLWEASESADTRCWGLLPREIQVARIELPAGIHQLSLEPIILGKPIASAVDVMVEVQDGANTYALSFWPGIAPVGKLLVSHR